MFQPCLLIPVYNHSATLNETLAALRRHALTCLVVDDGSDCSHASTIKTVCQRYPWVILIRHPQNVGKGAAVKTAIRIAAEREFSHALQIDADAQHDLAAVDSFIKAARSQPQRTILGHPVFDRSMPAARRFSRYITHVWVWINTLSFEIADAMCGFRVYPVGPLMAMLDNVRTGDHMEFDIEIVVRMYWSGMRFTMLPVATCYPEDGRSHFRLVRDNALISAMHAKLFFAMLARLPGLILRKLRASTIDA